MAEKTLANELYLAVLPLIHITETFGVSQLFGTTEQTLTLFPDKNFASSFFPEEVDDYIKTFKASADRYLTGGHVIGYDFHQEPTEDGRVIVRVIQNVR